MPLMDAHVHVWTFDPAHPFPPGVTPPGRSATAEELLAVLDAHHVPRAVLVQPIQYRWDNGYLSTLLRRHPQRFAAVCRVDPLDPAAPDHLSRWTAEGFRGVRLSPAPGGEGDWFDGPLMDPLLDRAATLGVPLLFLSRADRIPRLETLLQRHPGLDVCIDHMAGVGPADEADLGLLVGLARYPRVRVKISQMWDRSRQGFPWLDCRPLVLTVRKAFGAGRLLWCSDWPVSQGTAEYGQTVQGVEALGVFESGELDGVMGGNAAEWWPTRPATPPPG